MAITVLNIIPRGYAANTQSTQYTSSNAKTVIDKFTVTNVSSSAADISVNLVAEGDTASDADLVVDARTIAAGETYTCPELIGQVLESGGFISTLASASSALVLSASGRVIT
jgi:hypothetical protein